MAIPPSRPLVHAAQIGLEMIVAFCAKNKVHVHGTVVLIDEDGAHIEKITTELNGQK